MDCGLLIPFRGSTYVHLRSAALILAALALMPTSGHTETSFQSLKSFGYPDRSGSHPHTALMLGADGAWYGTTQFGGTSNAGTVFRVNSDGTDYNVLHTFAGTPDGSEPYGKLVQGSDGTLYGTTVIGGSNGLGTVFKLSTNGGNYAVLHHFSTNVFDGQNPRNSLIVGQDGFLYGTTATGGTNAAGTLFKLSPDGVSWALLSCFAPPTGSGGAYPVEILQGFDGALYGMTLRAVPNRGGTAFKLNTNGTGYTNLWTFDAPAGSGDSHHAGLSQGSDGMLYGTISSCRSNTVGAVFKLSTNGGDLVMLHGFTTNNLDGQIPDARLLEGADGALFGTTVLGGANGSGTLFKINRDGSGYTALHNFGGVAGDGQWPSDVLSRGNDGSIYGATLFGGAFNEGTLFKVGLDGNGYSVLRSFSRVGGDGEQPRGRLVCGQDGCFYGTTIKGGSNDCGTVFKLNPTNGTYALLHEFTGEAADGKWPVGGLVQAADGALYGTTSSGGDSGFGTVFKLSSDGSSYTVLYSFATLPDGNLPSGTLLQGDDGFLYGVTGAGGSNDAGTVFKLGTNGTGYSLLHTFTTNGNDAWGPVVGLTQGADGVLYGTTADNGTNGAGTVYKLNPDGTGFTVLHSFITTALDGWTPYARLLLGQDGALYGTTRGGGQASIGTVFRLSSDGISYTILRNFSNVSNDGKEPFGELFQGNDGILYGTTCFGGSTNDVTNDLDRGSVFQLSTNGGCYLTLLGFCGGPNGANPSAGLFQDRDGFLYGSSELGGCLNAGTIFKLGVGPTIFVQPQDQSVTIGGNAAFSVTATGGGSLNYQWLYNGLPLTDALDSTLSLAKVARTNAGVYSVKVTNAVGTALSSNGTLIVQVPQLLSRPVMSGNGSFQLTAAYTDGWALQADDVARFEAQASSNLLTWTTLPNSLTWSNGLMLLSDSAGSNQPVRFYRILEH